VNPVVKWLGGKRHMVRTLLSVLPERFGRYYEPFAGGAALFFALCPQSAVIGDRNEYLLELYECLRSDADAVFGHLSGYADYYAVRRGWNEGQFAPGPVRASAFLWLNRMCFNGLWRVNRHGAMNSPRGDARPVFDFEALRAAGRALRSAELIAGDYRAAVSSASAGDVVYLDPPYDGTYAGYTVDRVCQAEIAFTSRTLAARGVHVIASNADTAAVRTLYAGWQIREVSRRGTVSSNGRGRQRVQELLIVSPDARGNRP
jgi:DNA adenine methylase